MIVAGKIWKCERLIIVYAYKTGLATTMGYIRPVAGIFRVFRIMVTLWQATDRESAVPFDRKNVIGLHHLALIVENDAALDQLYECLRNTGGVNIEFAPESLMGGPTRHMMCYIPGGIRVEFIAPAG